MYTTMHNCTQRTHYKHHLFNLLLLLRGGGLTTELSSSSLSSSNWSCALASSLNLFLLSFLSSLFFFSLWVSLYAFNWSGIVNAMRATNPHPRIWLCVMLYSTTQEYILVFLSDRSIWHNGMLHRTHIHWVLIVLGVYLRQMKQLFCRQCVFSSGLFFA